MALTRPMRGGDRRFRARRHDGAGDGARARLLAEDIDDVGERFLRQRVHRIRRLRPGLRHAHVERPVAQEGEAARGLVDLHGGDADVEHHAVDAAHRPTSASMSAKRPSRSVRRPRIGRDQRLARADGRGIAVDGDDAGIGGVENGARVAAGAEGAVDIDAAVTRLKRIQHFGQHHGHVG